MQEDHLPPGIPYVRTPNIISLLGSEQELRVHPVKSAGGPQCTRRAINRHCMRLHINAIYTAHARRYHVAWLFQYIISHFMDLSR